MRTIYILCLFSLLFGCFTTKSSSSTSINSKEPIIEYDKDFVKFIQAKWKSEEFSQKDLDKFSRVTSFYNQLKIKDEGILSDLHMSKPDNNILVANYIDTKLQWNRFNQGSDRLSIDKVIENTLDELAGRNELLAFYYKTIFIHVLNNQGTIEPYQLNLNFEQLDLNEQEGSIMFLCAMRLLGNQMSGYSNAKFPDNCFRAHKFLNKIPLFNGKIYYEFELPEFEDFPMEVSKMYSKVSFKENYIPIFEKSKEDYKKCLDIKK